MSLPLNASFLDLPIVLAVSTYIYCICTIGKNTVYIRAKKKVVLTCICTYLVRAKYVHIHVSTNFYIARIYTVLRTKYVYVYIQY